MPGMDDTNDFDFASAEADISDSLFDSPSSGGGAQDGAEEDPVIDAAVDSAATEQPASEKEEPATETVEPEVKPEATLAPPKTWRAEALAKWETLPAEVQREVLKREEDIFKGLESYKADAQIGRSLNQVLSPYMPMLQQAGVDPMQQVTSLMQAHHGLATGTPEQKQRFFSELARMYNVPLSGELAGEESPFTDPQVAALQKEIAALKSKTSAREQQEAATVRATLQKEIDSFAADPKNVYFDEVATDIAALLKSGTASTLAEAYEKAIWLNPATRVKEQSRLTAETEAKAKAEAEAKAAAAKKATAANVRSSPKSASAAAPLGSIDDTLSAALNSIRSRA